jgi:hypothetical protein
MSTRILFLSQHSHPRLRYVVRQVFEEWLGLKVEWQLQDGSEVVSGIPAIQYGGTDTGRGLFIPAHPYLDGGVGVYGECIWHQGVPSFFSVNGNEGKDIPFDVLALIFFFLSRHEEYGVHGSSDHLGRFSSQASLARQHGFLHLPVVDYWLMRLKDLLKDRYKQLGGADNRYTFEMTYDIDYFWAYRQRPLWHQAGGILKSVFTGQWLHLVRRIQVLTGVSRDPFFTFQTLHDLHQQYEICPRFFVLVGDFRGLDRANSWRRPAVRRAIQALSKEGPIGLHPSVASSADLSILRAEKQRLEEILGRQVTISRQHFLNMTLPETYRQLIEVGITDDYTLGFADVTGFRASTTRAFRWYDLEKEEETALRVHPFVCMDVALRRQSGGNPERALQTVKTHAEVVRSAQGILRLVWHNSSFYDLEGWAGWDRVHAELLRDPVGPL